MTENEFLMKSHTEEGGSIATKNLYGTRIYLCLKVSDRKPLPFSRPNWKFIFESKS